MAELLRTLVKLGEKAGNLARIIRAEKALFELLVEEKTGEAKNKKFVHDFKTLADVLIQEMIRYDLGVKFQGMAGHVFGEESNKFTNMAGESITVEVQATPEATRDLLTRVLDGNTVAATLLAQAVHADADTQLNPHLSELNFDLSLDALGVWIDPIDSTAEYIKGIEDEKAESGVYQHGLQCAAVLIGAFDRETGVPVLGIINQPFAKQDPASKSWTGHSFWGVQYKDICFNSCPSSLNEGYTPAGQNGGLTFVMSSNEDSEVKNALSSLGTVHFASGAGYKQLCVIEGHVDAYIFTKGSTFKWDTCGPHAILNALGGGIVDFGKWKACDLDALTKCSPAETIGLKYNKPDREGVAEGETWANAGGLIAYRHKAVLEKIYSAFHVQ